MPRGTPLYGQPSWWGDDEAEEENGYKQDGKSEERLQEPGVLGKFYLENRSICTFPSCSSFHGNLLPYMLAHIHRCPCNHRCLKHLLVCLRTMGGSETELG